MISKLFEKYKKLGQHLLDAVEEVKQKNFAFTVAKRNTLIFIIAISLIITLLKPSGTNLKTSGTKYFEGTIVCVSKFDTATSREFKDGKIFTKVRSSSGKPFETNSDFSNLNTIYKDQVIEWTGYLKVKGTKYPVKESIDLKTMSYYSDLNIFKISSPKKRKLDHTCTKE
jgi:hypothetical protein